MSAGDVVMIGLCLLISLLQWRLHRIHKRIEQNSLDLGFSLGRGLGKAETDEKWARRLAASFPELSESFLDFATQANAWVAESKSDAKKDGVSDRLLEAP